MPYPQIDPIAFSIGPVAVHWYGIAYVVGIMLGWFYARRLIETPRLWAGEAPATRAQLDDFLVWAAVGIILGGRVGYILFYDFPNVAAEPLRAIQVWNGGMSFHGGLAGTTLAMILFARRSGIAVWSLFDIVAAVVPIGLFFGRLANFVNGELWGKPTDVPWAIVFPGSRDGLARHPSQLYEAGLEGLVLFAVLACLFWFTNARRRPGMLVGVFLLGYGLARFTVEFFREPDAHLVGFAARTGLHMGQWLTVPMIAAGIYLIVAAWRRLAQPAGQISDPH